jgi:hypothetical protein
VGRGFSLYTPKSVRSYHLQNGKSRTVQIKSGAYADNQHTVIKADFSDYAEVDYIILHDRVQHQFYIFSKGELNGRRTVTMNPKRLTQQLNNWKRIK